MKLRLEGHDHRFSVEQMQLMLFPEEKMEFTEEPFDGDGTISALHRGRCWLTACTLIRKDGASSRGVARCPAEGAGIPEIRRILKQSFYKAALPLLPVRPAWGSLSGVRPTKLVSRHFADGGTRRSADRMLRDVYDVEAERRQLCLEAAEETMRAWEKLDEADISLYIGIPFCPTRCIYCSFVSASVEQFGGLVDPYLSALQREIAEAGRWIQQAGKRIRTVYIGGGTPTTLSEEQLQTLFETMERELDLSCCSEMTVEAGRPDTLDEGKLRCIARHGATRISINPQTMDDSILELLGRKHTSAMVESAYDLAIQTGHRNINMDLIAGLPGDSPDGFSASLQRVLAMRPANITVHTLALKKAAALYYSKRADLPDGAAVRQMLDSAMVQLREAGYRPYYLYRQKQMTGSYENVGWCLAGTENLYNIYMMEELHTVLALGAGGVTKIVDGRKVSRVSNPKYPQEYIRNLDQILRKKEELRL